MERELVLAIYARDYSWIKQIDESVRITRYTKNDCIMPYEIFLPNVGRCVHTFFNHLYRNYHCLADYTFFSQDDPFDHVANYVEIINGNPELWDKIAQRKAGDCWFFSTQCNGPLTSDAAGGPWHHGLPIAEFWEKVFVDPFPGEIEFVAAGHFCVAKEQVLKIPREYLKKIVDLLENYDVAPWVIERFELYIFENLVNKKHD
jgi:hypothetical protein